jgi:hypothetical protein
MADKQPTKSKRRVKNPETFRERALKANEAAGRSKAKVGVGRSVGTGFGYVTRPFVRILKPILTSLPFRLVGKVLGKAQAYHGRSNFCHSVWRRYRRRGFCYGKGL